MAFEEDLSLFLSVDEFAVTAVAVNSLGATVQFQVIFDNAYAGQLANMVDATGPAALARSVDVAQIRQGNPLTIGSDDWVVTGMEPDGTGMTLLTLRRA